jgi:hypothetical protein
MLDDRERLDNQPEAIRALVEQHASGMWTAIPATVTKFDAEAGTVAVQPVVKQTVTQQDGTTKDVDMPPLPAVPVLWPGGGGMSLTFPIAEGDEVLVVFASRSLDAWLQSGGIQKPMHARKHNLSDGIAIPCLRNTTRKIAASTSFLALRSDDDSTHITIDPGGHVTIVAPGGVAITGDVTIQGKLDVTGDVHGQGKSLHDHTHTRVTSGSDTSGPPA